MKSQYVLGRVWCRGCREYVVPVFDHNGRARCPNRDCGIQVPLSPHEGAAKLKFKGIVGRYSELRADGLRS